ncbi:hypothetical protein S40293_09870 [Stachybotrys chartarum IBT 40293]|nr:hypothetical protein S40293_09870 [Stachybotrys chartarum IBT 40293]
MKEGSFLFTLVTALGLVTAQLVHNLVALKDYGVFSGTILDQTVSGQPLASKVDAWLGIDYATQPVGERRFKRAEWARPFRGIKAASQRARSWPLGSLPSPLFEEESLLNLGLLDQNLFLQFVQKHASSFGADPGMVTLGGLSAGGHAVGIHHFGDYDDMNESSLFARVIYQSGSVTARTFPNATCPLYQTQYEEFTQLVGCPSQGNNEEILACLRSTELAKIRDAGAAIFDRYNPIINWPWQPVKNAPLFENPGSQSGYERTFFQIPTLTTTVTDEAKTFVPGTLETGEEFLDFLRTSTPGLNDDDLRNLEELYPDPVTDPESPYIDSFNSTQYNRLAAAWGDFAYRCPIQETSYRVATAGQPIYKLRWNTGNRSPTWQGIPHGIDSSYVWNEPDTEYPEMRRAYHAYISNFVLTGNPNTYRLEGMPKWPLYKPLGYGLEFSAPKQLVVGSDGASIQQDEIRRGQCLFWRDPERALRLNK